LCSRRGRDTPPPSRTRADRTLSPPSRPHPSASASRHLSSIEAARNALKSTDRCLYFRPNTILLPPERTIRGTK
jgi:hypothetical protein